MSSRPAASRRSGLLDQIQRDHLDVFQRDGKIEGGADHRRVFEDDTLFVSSLLQRVGQQAGQVGLLRPHDGMHGIEPDLVVHRSAQTPGGIHAQIIDMATTRRRASS